MKLDPSLWRNCKVLLTGHTGFKGTWLAAWLHKLGAQVQGFSLPPDPETNRLFLASGLESKIASHHGDIRDLQQLQQVAQDFQPEIILHLAAQALVRDSYTSPVETYATNVMGTVHVLEVARILDSVTSTLIVTTDKCYENQEWLWPYRENDRLGGHDPYSNSKACAELVTSSYRSSFLAGQGKKVASARAGNVIGGGDYARDRLVPDAIRAFSNGQTLEIRSPNSTRPWQHVLDPLHGYLLLAQALITNQLHADEPYNFGPPDEHTVGEVVQTLVDQWPGASFSTPPGEHPHEASRLHLDSRKARHHLGWQPRLDFQAGLAQTIDFYRAWLDGSDPWTLLEQQIESFQQRPSIA